MRVNDTHRLLNDGGSAVSFVHSPNSSGAFAAGEPRYLIMHYTAGGTAAGAISTFASAASQVSAHLVIDHNGSITQMLRFDEVGWDASKSFWAGLSGLNRHAIGIEIANCGLLSGSKGNWRSWTGALVPDQRVIEARHKSFEPGRTHGWEIFDEDQMAAAVAAAQAIVQKYGIPPANILGHDDIAPVRKQDPGPAFDMTRFRARVFGRSTDEDDLFAVVSPTGLNLRVGPSIADAILENLRDGTRVRRIAVDGSWFMVNTLNAAGQEDKTGWVNARWLQEI